MEPPAKRLRILQSVDVDEDNAAYLQAKQKQQKRLKSTMESIFAKYETMHESMSDIIDMKANKVVVDRGHLRRLQRKAHRSETTLLDAIGLSASKYEDEPLEEKDDEDTKEASEDELAPTQCPTPSCKEPAIPTAPAHSMPTPQHIPQTPGPAENLLQLVQFPQTSAGQEAQSAFYTTLTHTINQAVQQAVAPLFSQFLPNTPSIHQSMVQAPLVAPVLTTPSTCADTVAPATDPKWSFPPLPTATPELAKAHSSPIPLSKNHVAPRAAKKNINEPHMGDEGTQKPGHREAQVAQVHLRHTESGTNPKPGSVSRQRSPRVVVQRTRNGQVPSYLFTEDDDTYISKRRIHDKLSWAEIRDSRERWRTWPLSAFQRRWHQHSQTRNLQRDTPWTCTTQDKDKELAVQVHHLPTPSSSRHEDHLDETVEPAIITERNDCTPSRTDYRNDDALDLLSVAGDDHQVVIAVGEDELHHAESGDIILPSIETAMEVGEEETIQQHLTKISSTTIESISTDKTEITSSTQRTKQSKSPPSLPQSMLDAELDSGMPTEGVITDSVADPLSDYEKLHRSTSIDLVGDENDLFTPTIPHIKHEPSTPLPPSSLCHTPGPKPRTPLPSSNAKPLSKFSNKVFRKQVKQSWTTKTGWTPRPKATAKALPLHKRSSFPMLGSKKPAWGQGEEEDEEAGSEDELAM